MGASRLFRAVAEVTCLTGPLLCTFYIEIVYLICQKHPQHLSCCVEV